MSSCRRTLIATFLALFAVFALCSTGSAQSFYGSIVGTVTDSSGAVIPGANVTVTNLGTNESRTVKADTSGGYRFVNLLPANYKVTIEAPSFKRFERQPVAVSVDVAVRADAALEIGAASETVEVTTETPLLQTESGSLSENIQGKQVQEIPLNGRNTMNLIALAPGVVPQGYTEVQGTAAMNNGSGGTTSGNWGNYQIGGAFPLESTSFVDGAPTTVLVHNNTVFVPTPDVIQEFNVEFSGVGPEFGRFGGGVVNMTTKSGTNSFHGTAYEFLRNSVLNANYFFSNRSGAARPQWTQNQFGVAGGGPIWRDKAFFYGSWEAIHIRTAVPTLVNVPTVAMQNGVIPEVYGTANCTAATGTPCLQNKVTDPRGICSSSITHQPGTAANPGTWTIPTSCFDPTAKAMLGFFPSAPNNPGNPAGNWYKSVSEGDDGYQVTGRIDYDLTHKQRLFGRYTYWPLVDEGLNVIGINNGWNMSGSATHNHTLQIVLGDTYSITPSTVLDVRADLLRSYGDAIPPQFLSTSQLSQLGPAYAAFGPQLNASVSLPQISFSGGTQYHSLYSFTPSVGGNYYNSDHLSGSLTKVFAKHTVKVGAEGRLMNTTVAESIVPAGTYTFSGDLAGDEWANFLLGYPDSATVSEHKRVTTYTWYSAVYAGDNWHPARNLTVNYGLRWENPGQLAESRDNNTVLLPNTVDPVTGITGTLGLVNSSLYPNRTSIVPTHKAFGPRVGFAYNVFPNTVIRGGYALSYLSDDFQAGAFAGSSPINAAPTTNTNRGTPTYLLSNPFPAGIAQAAGRSNPNFMVGLIGQAVSGAYPYSPYPHSQGMDLSVGQQLPGNLLVEVSGVHTLGTHLWSISAGLDQLPDQYDICGTDKTQPQCNGHLLLDSLPASAPLKADGVTLPTAYQTYGQTLRPFPYYSNYSNSADYHRSSSYNALEVRVQKRFKSAGQIGGSYTWSKTITDTDTIFNIREITSGGAGANGEGFYQDYTNPKGERAISSYDVPNRLVINYVLNLPFGHGQRFGANAHGVGDKVISGWAVDGITTFESGFPLYMNISGNNLSKFFGAGTIRPKYTAGCQKTISGSAYARTLPKQTWFNTSCFTAPTSFSFGNEPRVDGTLKSQGIDNFDFAAVKNTPLHEQIGLQFRVEFFNIFNRVQFAPPITQADSTQFGQTIRQGNQPRLIQAALRLSF